MKKAEFSGRQRGLKAGFHGRRRRRRTFERLEDRRLLALFSVNTLLDTVDANPGDGIARDAAGETSLRAAIMEANARAGDDSIVLPAGTYNLTLAGANEDGAATGDLDVAPNGKLTITTTSGASAIVDAAAIGDRAFHVLLGGNLNISGVAIRNASILSGDGGGILNSGTLVITNGTISGNTASRGGGILNAGLLTMRTTTVLGNMAGTGGGVYDAGGSTVITASTISSNTGTDEGVSVGGIEHQAGTLSIANSTVSVNSGQQAGGVYNNAALTLISSTVANNSATSSAAGAVQPSGGIFNSSSGSMSIQNTIVAANSIEGTGAPDFYGAVTSLGHNLIGDTALSTGWVASDLRNMDPLLGPLASNGGPTQTQALLTGSPAIDAGTNDDVAGHGSTRRPLCARFQRHGRYRVLRNTILYICGRYQH